MIHHYRLGIDFQFTMNLVDVYPYLIKISVKVIATFQIIIDGLSFQEKKHDLKVFE